MRKGPVNSHCVHFQSHKKYLASGSCSCELVSAGGAKTSLGKKGHVVQRGIFDDLELYESTCPAVVFQVSLLMRARGGTERKGAFMDKECLEQNFDEGIDTVVKYRILP